MTLTKGFEQAWHAMLNLKPPESSCARDALVERSRRPRDDNDPWSVAWHQVEEENKVVINWMNGKSRAKSTLFLSVVWWINLCGGFLGGTLRPRTDEK